MKAKKLSAFSSIILVIAALLIVASMFFPWWRMEFFAPQYPEGLNIIVYPDRLEGEIANINALNHYIGMAEFGEENFPELQFLPYLIGGLALLVLIGAIIRKKGYLYFLIGLFIVGGTVGVWDLYRALKQFGTNLDPMAPIDMDPFVPPIVGENIIANFTTYSILGTGTYFVIAAFILLLIPLWKDRKQ
jgi:copper chaperone NosL